MLATTQQQMLITRLFPASQEGIVFYLQDVYLFQYEKNCWIVDCFQERAQTREVAFRKS